MTSTLERPVSEAIHARAGQTLYRYAQTNVNAFAAIRGLASPPRVPYTVNGVSLLKVGTFNGLQIVDGDLEAMVERFGELIETGVFQPPLRLDHSWSVLSVIGHVTGLSTAVRLDETDGQSKLFLDGDLLFTEQAPLDAVHRGTFRNLSSELGPYDTNAGVELPMIYYGVAFVDIPAVEGIAGGLGPLKLRKADEPASVFALNEEESSVSETSTEQTDEETTPPTGDQADESTSSSEETTEGTGDTGTEDEGTEETSTGDETSEEETTDESTEDGEEEETTDDETTSTAAGLTPDERAELTRLRASDARHRAEQATAALTAAERSGVVTPANRTAVEALLRHDDETVRTNTRTLLASTRPPVTLGHRSGRTQPTTGTNAGNTPSEIVAGMDPDEVGALWASLTPEERRAQQGAYDAWRADRDGVK